MTPGQLLRQERKRRGLTLKQAGAELGYVAGGLCDIENGRNPLSDNVRAAVLGVWGLDIAKGPRVGRQLRDWLRGSGELLVELRRAMDLETPRPELAAVVARVNDATAARRMR